ncbi:MAG: ubiquitin-like domain-containing protein, partial [Nitriliruptoraceae bacterium]
MSLRRSVLAALGAIAAGGVALGLYLVVTADVAVHVDGGVVRTRTSAVDVDAALAHLGIVLAAADEVEPPGPTAVVDGLVITVRRAVSVEVRVDDRAGVLGLEGDRFVVTAVLDSMGAALADSPAAGAIEVEARFDPTLDRPVADGDRLAVEVAVPVTIRADGTEHAWSSYAADVSGALAERALELGPDDRIEPSLTTPLEAAGPIVVARVEVVEEVVEVVLEHERREERTDDLLEGEQRIASEGRDGLRRDTYTVVLVDGEGWHAGVIGIVASRLVERTGRPACVVGWEAGDIGKASGRSVAG